jgi:DNA-binding GntR family transcriptional regulator
MPKPAKKPREEKPTSVLSAPPPRTAEQSSQQFSRPVWLANILRDRIVNGLYQPGSRIREANLQQEFGFSNGPIREALQMIVADGLAQRTPWQGVRVIALDEKQIVELFQVRLALLEYAAELAARCASKQSLAAAVQLKKNIDEGFLRIKSGSGLLSFHGELSQWLLSAAGNEKLQKVWDTTMLQTLIYVNASMRQGAGARSRALIHRLIDAIVARDVLIARDAARKLTQQTVRDLGINGVV